VGAGSIGFHNAPFGATRGRGALKLGGAEILENGVIGSGVHTFVAEGRCGRLAVGIAWLCLCGFHLLDRALIARFNLPLPIGWRGESGVDEMSFAAPMGGNENGALAGTGTRAG
jgi:hypothetical protein